MTSASNGPFVRAAVIATISFALTIACDPEFVMTGSVTTTDGEAYLRSYGSSPLRWRGSGWGGLHASRWLVL